MRRAGPQPRRRIQRSRSRLRGLRLRAEVDRCLRSSGRNLRERPAWGSSAGFDERIRYSDARTRRLEGIHLTPPFARPRRPGPIDRPPRLGQAAHGVVTTTPRDPGPKAHRNRITAKIRIRRPSGPSKNKNRIATNTSKIAPARLIWCTAISLAPLEHWVGFPLLKRLGMALP